MLQPDQDLLVFPISFAESQLEPARTDCPRMSATATPFRHTVTLPWRPTFFLFAWILLDFPRGSIWSEYMAPTPVSSPFLSQFMLQDRIEFVFISISVSPFLRSLPYRILIILRSEREWSSKSCWRCHLRSWMWIV